MHMKKNLKNLATGNRQQATGNASLLRQRITVTPLRPSSAALTKAFKKLLVVSRAVFERNKT